MSHYKSNLRDIEFNLFEVFNAQQWMNTETFPDIDINTAKEFLHQTNELATGPLSETFASADRNQPIYDPKNYTVTMPNDFKEAYQQLMNSESWRMEIPTEIGGIATPPSLRWAVAELILGSNPAAFMYMSGPGFAGILHALGNEEQKKQAERMIENQWGATMVLTEPDAGSDVGAGTTKAYPNEDGSWHIEGVKRFITSAEHDMTDNIIHLVLARPVGVENAGGPGTKGLSLFIVPKYHFDSETGELGERNGVYVTNVEKKMGLKVSTTCELTFGTNEPATGWLIGDKHDGIAQMFKIIEYARMMVGTKAIATLSTGYLNALDYAKNRIQGADLTQMLDKTAPRIPIIQHPDVRRSLMLQKTYAEGMRALILYTASWQDKIAATQKTQTKPDETAERMNDLLLPIVKGVGSERSYEMLAQSLQTLGGSGYLQDYPIEQYIRDAKIDTLYEGTTAIQGLDFFFRKIIKDKYQAILYLAKQINETIETQNTSLTKEQQQLKTSLEDIQTMLAKMSEWALQSQTNPDNIYKVGLNTTRLLMVTGDLIIGWLLLKQALIAETKIANPNTPAKDSTFYQGKIEAAKWFSANRLPLITGEKNATLETTLEIMTLPKQHSKTINSPIAEE